MRYAALRFIVPFLPVLVVSACTDPVTTDVTTLQTASHVVLTCDLTRDMNSDVRSYLPQPERRTAQDRMRQLESACLAGEAVLTDRYAYELLALIERVVNEERGGDAVIGSRLVNALLACTTEEGCTAAALPRIDLTGAMSDPAGAFEVFTGDADHAAVARGVIPFDGDNTALFGVELSAGYTWPQVNGTELVLVYGHPSGSGLELQETSFGDLVYDFKRWPDQGRFIEDGVVHVGVCFGHEVGLPHVGDTEQDTEPRIQREGTLLSSYEPTFCDPEGAPESAFVLAPFAALTRSLLRFSGLMALTDKKVALIGGSALGFSRFAPVGANPNGRLVMEIGPNAVTSAGESLGDITIRAESGEGTPMELVHVTLYVAGNQGKPAGAEMAGVFDGYTTEEGGTVVLDNAQIKKPGGYTICAKGEAEGFTFEEACSSLFHINR